MEENIKPKVLKFIGVSEPDAKYTTKFGGYFPAKYSEKLDKLRSLSGKLGSKAFSSCYDSIFQSVKADKKFAEEIIEVLSTDFNRSSFNKNVSRMFELRTEGLVDRAKEYFGYNQQIVSVKDKIKSEEESFNKYFLEDMNILYRASKINPEKNFTLKEVSKEVDAGNIIVIENKFKKQLKGLSANALNIKRLLKVLEKYDVPTLSKDPQRYSFAFNTIMEEEYKQNSNEFINEVNQFISCLDVITKEAKNIYNDAIIQKEKEIIAQKKALLRKTDMIKLIKKSRKNEEEEENK